MARWTGAQGWVDQDSQGRGRRRSVVSAGIEQSLGWSMDISDFLGFHRTLRSPWCFSFFLDKSGDVVMKMEINGIKMVIWDYLGSTYDVQWIGSKQMSGWNPWVFDHQWMGYRGVGFLHLSHDPRGEWQVAKNDISFVLVVDSFGKSSYIIIIIIICICIM